MLNGDVEGGLGHGGHAGGGGCEGDLRRVPSIPSYPAHPAGRRCSLGRETDVHLSAGVVVDSVHLRERKERWWCHALAEWLIPFFSLTEECVLIV